MFAFGPWGDVATLLDPKGRCAGLRLGGSGLSLRSSALTSTPCTNSMGRCRLGNIGGEVPPAGVNEREVGSGSGRVRWTSPYGKGNDQHGEPPFVLRASLAVVMYGSRPSHVPELDRMSTREHGTGLPGKGVDILVGLSDQGELYGLGNF